MSDNRLTLIDYENRCSCKGYNLDKFLQPNILILLAQENLHGYSIIQKLDEERNFFGEKFDSTGVYRTLQTMEKNLLVESSWDVEGAGAARKTYQITAEGRSCLANWADTLSWYQEIINELISDINETLKKTSE